MTKTIFISLLTLGAAAAAPVTTDLWDASQAGFGGLTTSLPVHGCGGASDLFGTTLNTCEPGNTLLEDVSNQVNTFTWNTATVTLTSFAFYYNSDGNNSNNRLVNRLQLAYWDGAQYVGFYDSGAGAFPSTGTELLVTLSSAVTASSWQATFTNRASAPSFIGARLVELDGFGTTGTPTPEPTTFALAGCAVALLALRQRRA